MGDQVDCKDDPRAPHGFSRNASHSMGRYVCECEFWTPDESEDCECDDLGSKCDHCEDDI